MIARVAKGVFVVLVFFMSTGFAATKDYSGRYAQETKGKSSQSTVLQVVQTEAAVEVTRTLRGEAVTKRFPLDGTEGNYTTPEGEPGKCKAQLKNKYLLLESVVTHTKSTAFISLVRHRIREWWQLSADTKILTIRTVVDFPDFLMRRSDITPASDLPLLIPAQDSWTTTYQRTDRP